MALSVNDSRLLALFLSTTEQTLSDMESGWQALHAGILQPEVRKGLSRAASALADHASMIGLDNLALQAEVVGRISDDPSGLGDRLSFRVLADLRGRLNDLERHFGRVRIELVDAIHYQDATRRYHA